VYIFSLRQGISLARRDVPESTEDWGLGSVWREAKIQQLDRVINQAYSSAMDIYNKIQEVRGLSSRVALRVSRGVEGQPQRVSLKGGGKEPFTHEPVLLGEVLVFVW
jgi:hypothetical protein